MEDISSHSLAANREFVWKSENEKRLAIIIKEIAYRIYNRKQERGKNVFTFIFRFMLSPLYFGKDIRNILSFSLISN